MKSYIRRVNYYETDQMAVVHHSNYIRYFEEARISFIEQIGYSYKKLEDEDVISPVLGVSCQYKKSARFDDVLEVRVHLVELGKVKMAFRYEIVNTITGDLCVTGTSEHCFLNKDGKIVSLSKTNPEVYNAFLKELETE